MVWCLGVNLTGVPYGAVPRRAAFRPECPYMDPRVAYPVQNKAALCGFVMLFVLGSTPLVLPLTWPRVGGGSPFGCPPFSIRPRCSVGLGRLQVTLAHLSRCPSHGFDLGARLREGGWLFVRL